MGAGELLAALRRRWLWVLAVVVLSVASAAAVTFTTVPKYAADVQLFASAGGSTATSAAYQGGLFVQQRVESYARIVSSPLVLDPVIERQQLDTTSSELEGRITVTAPSDTVLIEIRVEDTDPQVAAATANDVAGQFAAFVADLESSTGAEPAPVKVSVVRPATVPAEPFEPSPRLNVALGLVAGLGVGVGLALALEALDRSVRSGKESAEIVGAPLLGAIPSTGGSAQLLLKRAERRSRTAESVRSIRTNLQFIDVDNHVRSLVVTSSVPSEGKTTTAINLASVIAQAGQRVLLVDADLRRPAVADRLNLASTTSGSPASLSGPDSEA